MVPFFWTLNYFGALRVDQVEEEAGMDVSRHKGSGYNEETSNHASEAVEELKEKRSSIRQSRQGKSSGEDVPESARDEENA